VSIFDCLTSLAIVAREKDWCKPKLVDEPVIDIVGARHPIAQLCSKSTFVANPILSGGEHSKVKLINGPNASGKSIYLKTVGCDVGLNSLKNLGRTGLLSSTYWLIRASRESSNRADKSDY
jgi:DNA mismatch repair ATPase MutS